MFNVHAMYQITSTCSQSHYRSMHNHQKSLFVFKTQMYIYFLGSSLDLGIANAKLTTESGISCGGYALFVQICADKDCDNSCEEQIIEDPTKGYSGGETILAKLNNCSNFISSHIEEYFFVKLTSWDDLTVSLKICYRI